jgi:uncharacterized protein YycO
MRLLLTAKKNIGSLAIRLFTWSKWSHISVLISDSYAIEASPFGGVKVSSVIDVLKDTTAHVYIDVPCSDPDKVITILKSQLGKPYDWGAVFSFWFRRNWQDDDKWFCSELPAWAFDKAGFPMFRAEAIHRLLPEHWWMLIPKNEDTQ